MNRTTRPIVGGLAAALVLVPAAVGQQRGPIPNHYEEAAVAEGERLGVGSAALRENAPIEVLSHTTLTLLYTAGKAGVRPGGGVRVGLRHLSEWSVPQTKDPQAEGYLTAHAPADQPLEVTIDFGGRFFSQYFAWQHMIEVRFPQRGLEPGETLQITLGDRTGGSPGIRVQPLDESCFVFKTYVDALGHGDYLPLANSPSVQVVAAGPCRLRAVMPSDAVVGQPTWCLVRAEDHYGNPAPRYAGTVQLSGADSTVQLPASYTFAPADRGVHRYEGIVFTQSGDFTLTAGDGRFQADGNPVRVAAQRPDELLLWGDLHGHTLFSDGRGTVEEFYDFAENVAGLDFCAVTDHAFEVLDEMWEHSKKITNRAYRPGRFVTFQAFEWSGITPLGGDQNCYFLEDDPPILRSTSYYTPSNLQMYHGAAPKLAHVNDVFSELNKRLRDRNVFCIPHYGGRQGNPQFHDERVQRMIEIFSEHRRSEDWASKFLQRGHRLGIMASTDGHYGNPGYGYLKPSFDWDRQEIGMAAVAVYAAERTRQSIFHALYDRRVYATSGERILLDFRADDHPMGSEYRTDAPPQLSIRAVGTAPIERIEIKKNGEIAVTIQPQQPAVEHRWRDERFQPGECCYYYVRVLQSDGEEAISSPVWMN